jgi:hypothetical protein
VGGGCLGLWVGDVWANSRCMGSSMGTCMCVLILWWTSTTGDQHSLLKNQISFDKSAQLVGHVLGRSCPATR